MGPPVLAPFKELGEAIKIEITFKEGDYRFLPTLSDLQYLIDHG